MNAHAILLSTAFRKIVFMMAQWELDRTSARYVKKKYIHCYIIMRLNTCYNQDGAGEFYLHIRVFYFSNLNVPSRMLQHTKKHRQLDLFYFNYS